MEQAEFSNVIVLNKCDLVGEKHVEAVMAQVVFEPSSKIISSSSVKWILTRFWTPGFSTCMKHRMRRAGCSLYVMKAFNNDFRAATVSESVEYGVSSFVYRSRAPFHPERLHVFLTSILYYNPSSANSRNMTSL